MESCFVSQRYWKMKAIHNSLSENINQKQGCFVSQRYWKMKAIHNEKDVLQSWLGVVLYPKDTEKWKQFTTCISTTPIVFLLFCIPKILKNESNSQLYFGLRTPEASCFVSQRYWKMKAIHNSWRYYKRHQKVVLYPKDTEKWKQFTTKALGCTWQM